MPNSENLGPDNAIWDDGEWISWGEINRAMEPDAGEITLFHEMLALAKSYYEQMDRHLSIYGELGEQYAMHRYGVELHLDPKHQGSDGSLGNDLVEIKTISPVRDSRHVQVKAAGNFGYLIMVKIDADFRIDSKFIRRKRLGPPKDGAFIVEWSQHRCEYADYLARHPDLPGHFDPSEK